ncbi:hypothetical protein [Elizabethkingia ursingii]|uniref:hypothetical protein n=1 Tax=Elizabethkingia ursingii TaxID=1756150 RepID=UPI00075179CD|nr:hypothetical protein [Elizabethkingia ursingii]KUY30395.1 hypothetical protein ATB96_01775 [Elizabethkingia ursingii]
MDNNKQSPQGEWQPTTNISKELVTVTEEVFQVGVSKVGEAYIYENNGVDLPSDADLIFSYDEAGNQIQREMLIQEDLP